MKVKSFEKVKTPIGCLCGRHFVIILGQYEQSGLLCDVTDRVMVSCERCPEKAMVFLRGLDIDRDHLVQEVGVRVAWLFDAAKWAVNHLEVEGCDQCLFLDMKIGSNPFCFSSLFWVPKGF